MQCDRYATAYGTLEQARGQTSREEAMTLLEDVAQPSTLWSVVYDMKSGQIAVAMGRDYAQVHHFSLALKKQ